MGRHPLRSSLVRRVATLVTCVASNPTVKVKLGGSQTYRLCERMMPNVTCASLRRSSGLCVSTGVGVRVSSEDSVAVAYIREMVVMPALI